MIWIKERPCEKLSGLTSLFVSFDFDERIVSLIKLNIDVYNYNKKTKEWEVPINKLAYLIDNLSVLNDVKLTLYKLSTSKETVVSLRENTYKLKPYKHQEEAIKFGLTHDKWLL